MSYESYKNKKNKKDLIEKRIESNDVEYIKQMVKDHARQMKSLGITLTNLDIIMETARDKDYKAYGLLFSLIDKSLISESFIREYIDIWLSKGVKLCNLAEQIQQISNSDDIRYGKNNTPFVGIEVTDDSEYEVVVTDKEDSLRVKREIREKREKRREEKRNNKMMEGIELKSPTEFVSLSTTDERNNPEFMLNILSKNPSLYVCLSDRLKTNTDFIQLLTSKVSGIETIIMEEKQRKKAEKAQKEKEQMERLAEAKKQREEDKKQRKIEEQNRIRQEYREQGKKHPKLNLVSKFLDANTSKISFCKRYDISMEQLNNAIEEVSFVYPEIATEIDLKNKQATAIHFQTIRNINSKLLSGEMTLKQYSSENFRGKKISDLLDGISSESERKQFHSMVVNAIASGELTMMDYLKLFSEKFDYTTIINDLNRYLRVAAREVPELQGKDSPISRATIKIKSLKKYAVPYRSKDFIGLSSGFVDSQGKTVMIPITEEHIRYAKKYLRLQEEYICYATMSSAISKLIKGEITFDEIEKNETSISMKAVVTNAINSGITLDDVREADRNTTLSEQTHNSI